MRYILGESENSPHPPPLAAPELERLTLEIIARMQVTYRTRHQRRITPEGVFLPGVAEGREDLERFAMRLFAEGSGVEGLEHLRHCQTQLAAGRRVLFLSEHRGNLDAPSFSTLVRAADPAFGPLLDKLVYVAGRKLNESSDFINMFAEKYARIVIVPRREYPPEKADESEAERAEREAFEQEARRINWAAFRAMEKLKRQGHVFVLFPTGGRVKPGEHNQPVKESTSYVRSFDTAYPISMDGNTLPPLPRMEDERPVQARVRFRAGPAIDCKAFLAEQKAAFDAQGPTAEAEDADQFTANRIMQLLAELREAPEPS